VHVTIEQKRIPFLAKAESLAETGYITGASGRNWESYGDQSFCRRGFRRGAARCSRTRKHLEACSLPARRNGLSPFAP